MEDRTCVVCGLSFTPSRTGSVCCSRACWASRGVPECSVDGCNKPNRARGMCGSHYNQALRLAHRMCNSVRGDRAA